jgi:putative endonuclease
VSDPRHALGVAAERATAAWLTRCGWQVLACRQRSPGGGEIDIVALDPAGTMVAVEVRARRTSRTGPAATSVDGRRIARLRRSLVTHAAACARAHVGLRVDIVTAEPEPGGDGRWRLSRIPSVG